MSAYDDLKDALKQNLRARGVTAKLEAAMRAELFKALDEEEFSPIAVPKETAVMNELVREYLQYNGYGHSLSVFTTESRLSKDIPTREHISQELSIHPRLYPENIPLLYGLAYKHKSLVNPDRVVAEQQPYRQSRFWTETNSHDQISIDSAKKISAGLASKIT